MVDVLNVALLLAGLAGLYTLAGLWKSAMAQPARDFPYGIPDAISAGLLSLWFITIIADSMDRPMIVTTEGILASAVVYGGITGLIIGYHVFRKLSLRSVWGLAWPEWQGWVSKLALVFVCTVPLVYSLQWLTSLVVPAGDQFQPLLEFWMNNPTIQDRALVVFMAVVMAPVAEEVIFRGYLYGVASKYAGRLWGMLAVSLLFAGIHVHLPSMPGLFAFAIVLTLVYEATRSLWAAIALHAAFNSLSLVISLVWPAVEK